MLRLTELKLPLDHTEEALRDAIVQRLEIESDALTRYTVYRRAVDARKRGAIKLIYNIDAEVTDEPGVLKKNNKNNQLSISPDTGYKFVARAPAGFKERPVVIGTGPCGYFAGLLLAQMGFKPIILDRGDIRVPRAEPSVAGTIIRIEFSSQLAGEGPTSNASHGRGFSLR